MCGVTLKQHLSNEAMRRRLGIDCVSDVVRLGRLRWFGHVERKGNEWVRKCMDVKVDGNAGRGRPRKSWMECVKDDMKKAGLRREMARDRPYGGRVSSWKHLNRASMDNRR
jgi:hypothetical protein